MVALLWLLWALAVFAIWLVCSGMAILVWRFVIDPWLTRLGWWPS